MPVLVPKFKLSTIYYGEFEFPIDSGNWYKGSQPPLITKELFDKV